ncbi:MAG: hypothetical protein JST65_22245 [Acidobacteria bacterium]|nr:hypothetical protein [Acidobacteriota bacterium]
MQKPRDPKLPSLLQERFTDRQEPLQIFHRYLEAVQGPFPALMFYGMGGIGKSWLLRKLRLELTGVHAMPSVLIDYTKEQDSNPFLADSLLFLAEVRRLTEWPCPQFDLAFAFTLVKRYRMDEASLEHSVKNAGAGMIWEAVKAAGGALNPVLGGALSVMEKAYGAVKDKTALSAIHQRFLKDIASLRVKELAALEDELCFRLCEDLRADDAFPLRPGHRAVQAIVLVDTLEALIPAGMSEVAEDRASSRLRELIGTLRDRVLFVLAGQNRLDWKFIDSDWENPEWLKQHRLSGLSEPDARDFLNLCRLSGPAVQQAILEKCLRVSDGEGYHPASLGLFADIGWLELRQGNTPTPQLFAEVNKGDMASLVRRFLKSLPSAVEQEWIRRLAVTPTFDEAAARAMHSETWSVVQDQAVEVLHGLSFLIPSTSAPGWWSVDSSIQDALQHAGQVPEAWHERWRAYWKSRENDALEWFHHWRLDRTAARLAWEERAEDCRKRLAMAAHQELLAWWEPTGIEESQPRDWEAAACLVSFGFELDELTLGDRSGSLNRAIACYEQALQVYTREAFPSDWAGTQNNLGAAYQSLPGGNREENLRTAIACYEQALLVRTREAFPSDWATTQFNIGLAWKNASEITPQEVTAHLRRALEHLTQAAYVFRQHGHTHRAERAEVDAEWVRNKLQEYEKGGAK